MNKSAAVNYFIPPQDYLWRWADEGSAVEWRAVPDWGVDSTVCLWMELHALLNHLAPIGLPPLGSVIMVIMACKGEGVDAWGSAMRLIEQLGEDGDPSVLPAKRRELGLLSAKARNLLLGISQLPDDLRSGLSARAHLLSSVFGAAAGLRLGETSRHLLQIADMWGLESLQQSPCTMAIEERLRRDLKALAEAEKNLDTENLESLLRTGLDDVHLQPAPIPEPKPEPGDSVLPLLRQLELHRDTELSALAGLARRMVAMFSLPRPAGHPQELPVGGISDITNRGPLDRLIPSELAYDDLTISARLANNEALYYRRDAPPDEPATERILLLDTGIHLWGTPRVFTLAAALGLQAGATDGESVRVFRREGDAFTPLALDSIAAMRDCPTSLHAAPDPEAALRAFQPDASSALRPDIFFLSIPWQRETVSRALHDLALRIAECGGRFYTLAITRTGALELSVRTAAGSRILTHGRIDPETLFASPSGPEKPAAKPRAKLFNLPAQVEHLGFYQRDDYPLRVRLNWREGEIMRVPLSAGFDSAGNLIIRAKGGSWEFPVPHILFKKTGKSMLSAVRAFSVVDGEFGEGEDQPVHAFYTAEWNLDCRLIFDTRGILHIVYHDRHGFVEIAVLCLLDKATAAWVRHWPEGKQHLGAKDWFHPKCEGQPVVNLTPLMQRFAAMARDSVKPGGIVPGQDTGTTTSTISK